MQSRFPSLLIVLALLVGCASLAHAGEKRNGIVVWKLQAKKGVTQDDIDSLTGLLTAEVEKRSGLQVISETELETFLKGEEKKAQCGNDEVVCITEIGNALGVPEAVSGDLGRVGEIWILNLRRIDVRKVTVIKRVSKQAKGGITAMVEALPGAVAELFADDAKAQKKTETDEAAPAAQKQTEKKTAKGDAAPAKEAASTDAPAEKESSLYWTLGWTSFGTGLGVMALGGVATMVAYDYADDYDKGDRGAKDSNRTWSSLAIAGYTVGGALVATGVVLLLLDWAEPEDAPGVVVSPLPDGSGVAAAVRFDW